jgi:hypothetical protein
LNLLELDLMNKFMNVKWMKKILSMPGPSLSACFSLLFANGTEWHKNLVGY